MSTSSETVDAGAALLDAGGLATKFESIPNDEAVALLDRHYGIAGTLKRLDTEKDDTFLVTGADGARFIAKISNPDEDPRELSLQSDALDHIAASDPTLPVPRVVRSRSGESFFRIEDSHGQSRMVRVLSYLDGTPLDRIDAGPDERAKVGAILARLRLAMAGFAHPHDGREIAWDVKHVQKLAYLVESIADEGRRAKLVAGLARLRELEPALAVCRMQVLHNDFSRSNIVVDRADPAFVTGIIDFGDVVRTYVVIDVSTALLNQLTSEGGPDMFDRGRDLLGGYLAVADLTDTELRLLPHLVMARVIARTLITTWRAEQFPENEPYIMRNTHQGWSQLDWFLKQSADEVGETFTDMAVAVR